MRSEHDLWPESDFFLLKCKLPFPKLNSYCSSAETRRIASLHCAFHETNIQVANDRDMQLSESIWILYRYESRDSKGSTSTRTALINVWYNFERSSSAGSTSTSASLDPEAVRSCPWPSCTDTQNQLERLGANETSPAGTASPQVVL